MELDLPMYKEAYKNIAIQIKELDVKDNKQEIKKLEELIKRNREQIDAFEKADYETADHSVWFNEKIFNEHEETRFKEYAGPYEENILKAREMIDNMEKEMDENQIQLTFNKPKQKELKVHMDNVRKNSEADYKKARAEAVEEWEKSDEKKKYDSNMETIGIINSRRPNLIKAEEEALIRLNGENIKLQQVLVNKFKSLEAEYNGFLKELDEIDKEYGIDLLEQEKETPEPSSDLNNEEPVVVDQPVTEFESAQDLDEEQQPEGGEQEPGDEEQQPEGGEQQPEGGEQEQEEQEEKIPLHVIRIEIDKEGSQATVVRKKGTYGALPEPSAHGKKTELSKETEKLERIFKKFPHVDKYVAAEFVRAKNEKLMDSEEMDEQFTIYSDLMKAEDLNEIEALKDKMKLELTYDLRGLAKSGIEKSERKYIETQAKKAKDLEIAEVTAPWNTRAKWAIQDFVKAHGIDKFISKAKNLLPKRNKVEELDEAQQDETQSTEEHTTKPGELSPEERRTQQEIARTVAEAMNENQQSSVDENMSNDINKLIENDGVEQE